MDVLFKKLTSSCLSLSPRQPPPQTSEMDILAWFGGQCEPYVWMTLAVVVTTFFHIILLSSTIVFINLNMTPKVEKEGEKSSNVISTACVRLRALSLKQSSSSPSQTILTTKAYPPHGSKSPLPVKENNHSHSQLSSTSKPKGILGKANSPLPPLPSICLPQLPQDRHTINSFELSDDDHNYDYIQLPINIAEKQKSDKPKEKETEECNRSTENIDDTEDVYDVLVHFPKEMAKFSKEHNVSTHVIYLCNKSTLSTHICGTVLQGKILVQRNIYVQTFHVSIGFPSSQNFKQQSLYLQDVSSM
ncbi:hypothetical protein GWK47_028425 [Chionoecetes opilio]|uniref:Uncharacterized protein n=1 Tax=Chionoecetes opilio TaxID=41210 RepID=A0A8J4YXI6_CHIOP|nr:hypothetical protein GWK47_028425 [Chionoecetes opilio]